MSIAIDITDRYNTSQYMRPGNWAINRNQVPFNNFIIHHIAGWYGARLTANATQSQERAQIDSLARDHFNRFGIGPGYNYCIFPSGRIYAVGKLGTQRRHTSNINPTTGFWWNRDSVGIVFFGNFETETPTEAAIQAANREINWLRTLPIVNSNSLTRRHGAVFNTSCPGRNLGARLADIARRAPTPAPTPPPTPAPPPPTPAPPPSEKDKTMELNKLQERIDRLEKVTYAYGTPVTVNASNKALVESLTGAQHSIGDKLTLRNERAMEYARRRGLSQAISHDNLNAAVLKLANRVNLSETAARDIIETLFEDGAIQDDAGHSDVTD